MDPYFIYGSDDQTKDWPDALEGNKKITVVIVLEFLWLSSLEQFALNFLLW